MSVINFANLELIIAEKISSATSPLEIQTYSKALAQIKHGTIYTVINFSDLPATQDSAGLLYYVSSEETVYVSLSDVWVSFGSNNNLGVMWGSFAYGMAGPNKANGDYSSPIQEFCNSKDWLTLKNSSLNVFGLKCDGSLWGWGYGSAGRLGIVGFNVGLQIACPVQELTSSTWIDLSPGMQGGSAIKNDGTLWSWGDNTSALANNCNIANCSSPVQEITSSTDWSKLSNTTDCTRSAHAIKTNGTMWVWGWNAWGQLALGDYVNRSSPTQEICSATNWCFANGSYHHSFAIKTDGTLWGTGKQNHGALGDGVCATTCINSWRQEVCGATNWCFVAGASCSSLAIKTDGTMWNWGNNFNGLLGANLSYPATVCSTSPIQEITSSTLWCSGAGSSYTKYGLKSDGCLYFWGDWVYARAALGFPEGCYSSPVAELNPVLWCQISTGGNCILSGTLAVPYYT